MLRLKADRGKVKDSVVNKGEGDGLDDVLELGSVMSREDIATLTHFYSGMFQSRT